MPLVILQEEELLELIGTPKSTFSIERSSFNATYDKNTIRGSIIHVDSYGNVITNIKKELFKQISKPRKFSIHLVAEDTIPLIN